MSKQIGYRRKGIKWDYNGDGRYKEEEYKAFWKRYWRRWKRQQGKKELQLDCELIRKRPEVD